MRKLLLSLCALALPLSSCAAMPASLTSPAPLAKTTIDDTALSAAWQAFDVALDAIDLYVSFHPEIKGTPKGKAIAASIDRVTAALTGAEHAAAAGSTTDYVSALADAKAALADLRLAIGSK